MKKFFLLFAISLLCASGYAQNIEISTRLQQKMQSLNPIQYVKVIVLLRDRVDVASLDENLYTMRADNKTRAKIVITQLMEKAASTQGPLLDYLRTEEKIGKVKGIESYWISNMIVLEANIDVLQRLSMRNDIEVMDLDAELKLDEPTAREEASDNNRSSEVGLRVIGADKLWQLGITGAGRLVMGVDTGVEGTHPSLSARWRGNSVPWYHAWMDKNGSTTFPTDCDDHGTHTMGIMTGRNGADTIGVAPGAQWIAARTICSSPHTSNSIAAFQWAMNPDSNVNTINDMPDAIGNSWHDPGLANECTSIYLTTLQAMEAAGIAVVFSCGNAGPNASTITKPKNLNVNEVFAFSVGNINGNTPPPYTITSSSSRGPSLCGGTGSLLIKPEVCAPGTSVRSSVRGGGFANFTGTSMACPHIVGAVALLKQYAPNLTGKQILQALYNTAVDLGTAGEDNTYGKGVIDVFAAYQSLGPAIMHTQLPNTENLSGPYPVNAQVIPSGSGIRPGTTKIFWTRTANFTDSVTMTNSAGNNWTGNIPGNGTQATYRYYIKTTDSLNRTTTSPAGAPANFYQFSASTDNIRPVITHTGLPDQPRNTWPATVTATITDNIGLDSGWVRWYKNNTGTGIKQFKLTNTSGSTFAAAFNSVMADVSVNDSIFYRVYAQDNSSAHNRDSSAQFKFKIINQATSCIGTGTNSIPYPFNTFWHNNVTDIVYLSSEILSNGGMAGNITKLRYDVLTASGQAMNNFEIKMQHTTNSTVTGFTSTGWTTVYSGTYTVPGTGLQEITLQNPFPYNGSQNLLIQICFDNTSFTSANEIKGTTASQQQFTSYADGVTGCIIAGSDPSTSKPNFCFVIQGPTSVEQIGSAIPQEYGLSQNYPNPFNPSTTISFALPKQTIVSLKVFDISGREIATLINNAEKTAGVYNVDFDASRLASGVYFYRIQAGSFVETKRMMLIK